MRVLVMGAGAVGSVFGGWLSRAGHEVHLVGRPSHMAAIAQGGLEVGGIWGEHRFLTLGTHTSAFDVRGPFDLILISTKAYDTATVVREALPLVGPQTLVASIQNGLGNWEAIAAVVGWERTVGGRVIFGVELARPGRVEVTVYADKVMLGSPGQRVALERIEELARAFTEAGIPAAATTQIEGYLWGKVLYNCALNPLSALLEVPYGALLEAEETKELMVGVVEECFAVGRAQGVTLFWERPEDYRRVLFEELIPPTAAHYASMYADLKRGKPTEIGALNGAIVRMGAGAGLPTPTNQVITRLVRAREKLGAIARVTQAGPD